MKALIYGKTGQVATELACQIPAGVEAMFLARSDADQTNPAACAALVTQYAPGRGDQCRRLHGGRQG